MSLNNARHVVLGSLTNTPPTPVISEKTVRCKFTAGYTPAMGDTQTLIDAQENIWDIYKASSDLGSLLRDNTYLLEVVDANLTGVEIISYIFSGCSSLTGVSLSNTSNLTHLSYAFQDCSSLTSVLYFDTSSAMQMNGMFSGCSSLATVPLFDTSSAVGFFGVFQYCTALTSVPLFDMSSARDMRYMFNGCRNLDSIPLFNTSSALDMSNMFKGCRNVQSGALALYQQASSQATPPSSHSECFTNCGVDTVTGAAELAQIPASWGGLGA